jgi:hypothetical protein
MTSGSTRQPLDPAVAKRYLSGGKTDQRLFLPLEVKWENDDGKTKATIKYPSKIDLDGFLSGKLQMLQ